MKKNILLSAFLILLLSLPLVSQASQRPALDINAFVDRIKTSLQTNDFPAYFDSLIPAIRMREESRIRSMFDDFDMDSLAVYTAAVQEQNELGFMVFLHVLFQNPSSVMMDLWRLDIRPEESDWAIHRRDSIGEPRVLYRIRLPSDRTVRARTVDIRHEDIHISFEDALCFYDNIPELDTAMIVIGKGRLNFSPSHPREQHQLELIFDKEYLEDRLEYVYLRFSPSFSRENIHIVPDPERGEGATQAEINKAYSMFVKHYSRSFTVRNSLDNEYLSVLPQGREAVFEFKGRKVEDATYVYSPFAKEEINFYQWKEERILNLYSPQSDDGQREMFITFGQKFDVLDYNIDIDFRPNQRYFAGMARVEVESKVDRLDSLKLKLNPDLEILRISDSDHRSLYYTEDNLRKSVYIHFLRPAGRGQRTSIEIFYRGRIEPPPVIVDAVAPGQIDQKYLLADLRFDTLLYSHSSLWYPAPDDVDYFTARIKFITPPDYQVISNGGLVERYHMRNLEDVEDVGKLGNAVHTYQTHSPVKYLSFVVGKFSLREEAAAPFPLTYYRGSQTLAADWDLFTGARRIIEYYQSIFGEFPFEKLDLVRRVWSATGGHSPASFIVLNDLPDIINQGIRPNPDSPVNLSRWKDYFMAHEVAHQWWGQGMAWDTYRDQWLSEGMAQFAAILFIRHHHGEKAFSQILERFSKDTVKRSKWGAITMGSRISYTNFEAYQTIVYNKTSLVLNMLRELLGDDEFFARIRRFFNLHRYDVASTGDFFSAFDDITTLDLETFFEMWFNSYLLPEIQVSHSLQSLPEGYRLKVRVFQTGYRFVFPLWVTWRENGKDMRRMILVDKQAVETEFTTGHRPEKIKFNPEKSVPGKFNVR